MICFPNAKINLGLRIVRKRNDGFHDIETVMVPVPLCDALEILPAQEAGCAFSTSGLTIDAPAEKNLCVKAYNLMRERCGIGGVKMHLHKHIPFGAGLGGGSADAAFALKMLNDIFAVGLPESELESLAAELGSDTAFFVRNRPALATGRGEILTPVDLDLSAYHIYIVKPPIHVGTAEAYAGIVPSAARDPLAPLSELKNDFEPVIFQRYPEIAAVKAKMYDLGAVYAAMSGSGSAVFGLFGEKHAMEHVSEWADSQKYSVNLRRN